MRFENSLQKLYQIQEFLAKIVISDLKAVNIMFLKFIISFVSNWKFQSLPKT